MLNVETLVNVYCLNFKKCDKKEIQLFLFQIYKISYLICSYKPFHHGALPPLKQPQRFLRST